MCHIKRYPNRKLYDTGQKRYVTLNDIARLIRDGNDVQVTDHLTGEDLTAVTLTQIIFEQEKQQAGFLPRSVLTGLVQAGGERLSTLRRALALPLGLRKHVDEEIARRLNALLLAGELDKAEAARLKALLRPDGAPEAEWMKGDDMEKLFSSHHLPSRADLALLETQLGELERKIEALLNVTGDLGGAGDAVL